MQSVKQRQYFVDPQQLPPGIRMEQVERALVNTDARRQSKNEATAGAKRSSRADKPTLAQINFDFSEVHRLFEQEKH
jgi:hypothetical protein